MSQQESIAFCEYCNKEHTGNFCSNCGRVRTLKRIDGAYILSEIGSILNFQKGIFYTVRELLLRPGKNVQRFLHQDRNRLVKPIVFVIVCSLIYTLLQQLLNFEDGYINYSFGEGTVSNALFSWVTKNYGYTNILMSIFMALWIKVFFRKQDYNFFEILILLCFVIGIGMLIFALFGILDSLIDLKIIDKGFFLGILYVSWGIGQFFTGNKWLNSLKGFLSYILGLMSFTLLILVVGMFLDWMIY